MIITCVNLGSGLQISKDTKRTMVWGIIDKILDKRGSNTVLCWAINSLKQQHKLIDVNTTSNNNSESNKNYDPNRLRIIKLLLEYKANPFQQVIGDWRSSQSVFNCCTRIFPCSEKPQLSYSLGSTLFVQTRSLLIHLRSRYWNSRTSFTILCTVSSSPER